jgi:hypothetical protein
MSVGTLPAIASSMPAHTGTVLALSARLRPTISYA